MNCFEVLEILEQTSGKNDKVRILTENVNAPGLAFLLKATFDYRVKYYIRDIPQPAGRGSLCPDEIAKAVVDFVPMLERLQKEGRTQACREDLVGWLDSLPFCVAKWLRRVILRDLRCGFSVDTCLKAGFDIPTFEVQLATDAKKCKNIEKIVKAGVWVSRKLDGNRCLAHGVDGVFNLYSRNGTVYENFPMVSDELSRLFPVGEFVFDGEIMSDDFQSMQKSAFANKRGTVVGEITYNIFDMIPPREWETGKFITTYGTRYGFLGKEFENRESKIVKVVEHVLSTDIEAVKALQSQYESEGFEGAMVNPEIPYYMGRASNKVMKFKSMFTWDCEVVGFEEGNGRLEGMLGKVIVKQENGKTCEVGSGFDDADRKEIWEHQDRFLGRILEAKYQELTPEKEDGTGGKMRFPIFMRWRNFEKGQGKL